MANDQYQIKQLDSYSVFLPPAGYCDTPESKARRAAKAEANRTYTAEHANEKVQGRISGSFIYAHPPNYRGAEAVTYTQADWKRELGRLQKLGIDTVIFQASVWDELHECYYKSELFKDYKFFNVVEPMLNAAKELNLTVFLGAVGSVTCWHEKLNNQIIDSEVAKQIGCFDELCKSFNGMFDGIYFSPESTYPGFRDADLENFLGDLYGRFFNEIRSRNDKLKIMMSPATFYHAGKMDDMKGAWLGMFSKAHPDILAPQDSIGCGCITLDKQVEALKIWRSICDEANIEFWSNVEVFECCPPYIDETSRRIAPHDRVVAQINNAAPYVSKFITWELLWYGNPMYPRSGGKLSPLWFGGAEVD